MTIAIATTLVIAIRSELDSRRAKAGNPANGEDQATFSHELMSPAWIAMARHEITSALSASEFDVEPFTLSEEFTDPPLRRGGDTIGFFVRVGQGHVDVGDRPEPNADAG